MPLVMTPKSTIEISLRTNIPFHNKEVAQRFLELVASYGIHYRPSKYGIYEPVRKNFDNDSLDDVIFDWFGGKRLSEEQLESQYVDACLLMKGRPPGKVDYYIGWSNWSDISSFGRFNTIHVSMSKKHLKTKKGGMNTFVKFCNDLVSLFPPAHAEVYDHDSSTPCTATSHSLIPDDLTIRCPALKWRTYFGLPYIKLLGRETILNAPCWKTEEVGDTVVLQLTESVFEEIPQDLRQSVVDYFENSVDPALRVKLEKGFIFRPFLASENYDKSKKLVPEFPFRESFGKYLDDEAMRELLTIRPIPKKQKASKKTYPVNVPYQILPKGRTPEMLMHKWQAADRKKGVPVLLKMDDILCETLQNGRYVETPLPDIDNYLEPYITAVQEEEEYAAILGTNTVRAEGLSRLLSFDANTDCDVLLASVPVEKPWEIFRYLPIGGCNDCPDTHTIMAFCRSLYDDYGAVPAVISGDTLELVPARKPTDGEAFGLALKMYGFCSDIVTQGAGSVWTLADSLKKSDIWYFWWD